MKHDTPPTPHYLLPAWLCAAALPLATLLLLASGGGILPWSVWVGTLLLLLPSLPRLRQLGTQDPTARAATLPFLMIVLYLIVMLTPVPLYLSLLSGIARFQENEAVHDMIARIREANLLDPAPASPWFAITRNRAGTMRILLYVLLCFAGYRAASRSRPYARALLWFFSAIIALSAFAGMLGRWVWPQGDTLWWYMRIAHGLPGPMAGFVNPNHYAGFLAIGIACSAALMAEALQAGRRTAAIAALTLLTVTGAGVLLSLSRGGLLASTAALTTVIAISLRGAPLKTKGMLLLPLLLLGIGLGIVLHANPVVRGRLAELRAPAESASGQDRLAAWRDSLRIAARYPIFGAGPNAFRTTYPMHRTHSDEQAYRTFAENEYIQLLTDCGLLGVLLAVLTLLHLLRPLLEQDAETATPPYLRTAALAALAAVAVHAAFEFVLHLPIYQLLLICLLALATPPLPHKRTLPLAAPIALLLILALAAPSFTRTMRRDRLGFISAMPPHLLSRYLAWAPTEAHIWARLGERLPSDTPAHRSIRRDCLEQAAHYDPLSASLQIKLARARLQDGDPEQAREAIQHARNIRSWVHIPSDLQPYTK